jgi:uncharacterized membrane protein
MWWLTTALAGLVYALVGLVAVAAVVGIISLCVIIGGLFPWFWPTVGALVVLVVIGSVVVEILRDS